jgi:23S rRNA (adenine2503-C2)-methyltransferase
MNLKHKQPLSGLSTAELETLVKAEGEPAYRGRQLAEWIYRHGARSFADMKNLPSSLKAKLEEKYEIGRERPVTVRKSRDGTAKLLLEMSDGARIETVALPYPDRLSCCVSTQVGCAIGCVFCASGISGFVRNLLPGEIVNQVLAVQQMVISGDIRSSRDNRRVDHIVFMGMGEPLLNYENTLKAIRLLNIETGIGIRNMTVSTVGIVPGIYRLAKEELQVTLAVSLHAPDDGLRNKLVPGMTRWNIAGIIDACREYIRATGRRVTFEYCLLEGINDSKEQAVRLADLLAGLNCHVNLIRFNTVTGFIYRPSSGTKVQEFRAVLERSGIQVTQRLQRGAGIDAACGQLRRQVNK